MNLMLSITIWVPNDDVAAWESDWIAGVLDEASANSGVATEDARIWFLPIFAIDFLYQRVVLLGHHLFN